MRQRPPDSKRRSLLKNAGSVAAATAAASVLPGTALAEAPLPAASTEPAQAQEEEGRGYRETEHTRRYYALARF
jgi:hypothetical protein